MTRLLSMRKSLSKKVRAMFDDRTQVPPSSNSDNDLQAWSMDRDETRFCVSVRMAQISMRDNHDVPHQYLAKLLVYGLVSSSDMSSHPNWTCGQHCAPNAAIFALFSDLDRTDLRWIIRMALLALFATLQADEVMKIFVRNDNILAYLKALCDPDKAEDIHAFDVLPLYYQTKERMGGSDQVWTWSALRADVVEWCSQFPHSVISAIVNELPE